MRSLSLTPRHEHLFEHRGFIVRRAVAVGLVGLAPIPLVDDWLAAVVMRRAVRYLAERRGVDLDPEAERAIAEGREPAPSWRTLLQANLASLLAHRSLRKLLVAVAVYRRAETMARTFDVLTLFDHYCARLHVGAGLDEARAQQLRAAIDEARKETRGVMVRLFRRGLSLGVRTALRAPLFLANVLSRGALERLLRDGDEARAEEVVEEEISRAVSAPGGFALRVARRIEAELVSAGRAQIADLVDRFERTFERTFETGGRAGGSP